MGWIIEDNISVISWTEVTILPIEAIAWILTQNTYIKKNKANQRNCTEKFLSNHESDFQQFLGFVSFQMSHCCYYVNRQHLRSLTVIVCDSDLWHWRLAHYKLDYHYCNTYRTCDHQAFSAATLTVWNSQTAASPFLTLHTPNIARLIH